MSKSSGTFLLLIGGVAGFAKPATKLACVERDLDALAVGEASPTRGDAGLWLAHITRPVRILRRIPRTLGVANLGALSRSTVVVPARCAASLVLHTVRCRADAADARRCACDVRGHRHRPR